MTVQFMLEKWIFLVVPVYFVYWKSVQWTLNTNLLYVLSDLIVNSQKFLFVFLLNHVSSFTVSFIRTLVRIMLDRYCLSRLELGYDIVIETWSTTIHRINEEITNIYGSNFFTPLPNSLGNINISIVVLILILIVVLRFPKVRIFEQRQEYN